MRRFFPLLLLLASCRTATPHDPVPELMRHAFVPGVAVGSVDGTRVTTCTYGATDETVFEAASLSKPVFAWAVMGLVQEGKLDLDRPLSTYVTTPYVNDPRGALITARMVLTHRTGFPNWRRRGGDLDIRFDPGSRFSYSGEGFIFLQRAVEAITGENVDAFMRRTVFDPLGMPASSYFWQRAYETTKTTPHDDAGNPVEGRRPQEHQAAAATLHTTAGDFSRFLSAMLADPRGMFVRQTAAPVNCSHCVNRPDPGPDSPIISWALGIALLRHEGREYVWHWGDNGPFKSYVLADPVTKQGAVVFLNGAAGLTIAGDIISSAVPALAPAAHVPLEWTRYDRWDSPPRVAFRQMLEQGVSAASSVDLPEDRMNALGYSLLRTGKKEEAVAIFRRNTERFPQSWNVWDSLGEGLAELGRREEAIAAYRRSLELNPENANANAVIEKLQGR